MAEGSTFVNVASLNFTSSSTPSLSSSSSLKSCTAIATNQTDIALASTSVPALSDSGPDNTGTHIAVASSSPVVSTTPAASSSSATITSASSTSQTQASTTQTSEMSSRVSSSSVVSQPQSSSRPTSRPPANNGAAPPSDQEKAPAASATPSSSTPKSTSAPRPSNPAAPRPSSSAAPPPAPTTAHSSSESKPPPAASSESKPAPAPATSSTPKAEPSPTKVAFTSAQEKPVSNAQSSSVHAQSSPTSVGASSTQKSGSSTASSSKGDSTSEAAKSSGTTAVRVPSSSGSHEGSATPAPQGHSTLINGKTTFTLPDTFTPITSTIGGAEGVVNSDANPSATAPIQSNANPGGFFADHSKVAGVFVTVSLITLGILALIPWLLRRYRRRHYDTRAHRFRRPSMSQIDPPFEDLHYRRQSEILQFGNGTLTGSAGAGSYRPGTGTSEDSHHMSSETHHSTEPMVGRFNVTPLTRTFGSAGKPREPQGFTNGYANVVPYPETRTPLPTLPELPGLPRMNMQQANQHKLPRVPPVSYTFYPDAVAAALEATSGPQTIPPPPIPPKSPARQSGRLSRPIFIPGDASSSSHEGPHSSNGAIRPPNPFSNPETEEKAAVASIAETSPSLYPPSLPRVNGDHDSDDESEETYWRSRGFENIYDSSSSTKAGATATPTSEALPTPTAPSSYGLGLKLGPASNSSQSTFKRIAEEENEIVKSLDPKMEPSEVHKGSTAPIRMPSAWNMRGEGRYPLLTANVPHKKPSWERTC